MGDGIDVPDEYDEPSYRAGYAAAMEHIGMMALDGASTLKNKPDADADTSSDESDKDTCDECGAELQSALGGAKCLNCDI